MKTCINCGTDISHMQHNAKRCAVCSKEYRKIYVRKYYNEYYKKHKAQVKKYQQKYQQNHKAECTERHRKWCEKNPEKSAEYKRKYYNKKKQMRDGNKHCPDCGEYIGHLHGNQKRCETCADMHEFNRMREYTKMIQKEKGIKGLLIGNPDQDREIMLFLKNKRRLKDAKYDEKYNSPNGETI